MILGLTYKSGNKDEERRLHGGMINIGRGADNDIVITDFSVSRSHARIVIQGKSYEIIDAGSRNGTFVNGDRIESRLIQAGDTITLGRFKINVIELVDESATAGGEVVLEERPFTERPGTIIRPMASVFEEGLTGVTKDKIQAIVDDEAVDGAEEKKISNILQILSEVARTLISADSLEEILNKVLDLTFKHLPVERGFLMLYDEEVKRLMPEVVKQRDGESVDQLVISKTISQKGDDLGPVGFKRQTCC